MLNPSKVIIDLADPIQKSQTDFGSKMGLMPLISLKMPIGSIKTLGTFPLNNPSFGDNSS